MSDTKEEFLKLITAIMNDSTFKSDQYLDEVFTYDSIGIEGNTLTLQETSLILNKGVTVGY